MGNENLKTLNGIFELIDTLRGDNGCPWDREQTPASMANYLAEETFELKEAIGNDDPGEVCEELGDVLFLLLFILRLYETRGAFDFEQVVSRVTAKMVRRHPHVFGDRKLDSAAQVRRQWQQIKKNEQKSSRPVSSLDSVPSGLPALLRAYLVSERASQAGLDWPDMDGVLARVSEEWAEFNRELDQQAGSAGATENLALEFGDVLFTLATVARFAGFHPETALSGAIQKFENRFRRLESILAGQGREMRSLSQAELDDLWEQIKTDI